MTTFRIMSYHINGLQNASGDLSPDMSISVIRNNNVDLVFVQGLGSSFAASTLPRLTERIGMEAYGLNDAGGCAFLSRHPLHNIQSSPLGYGGRCLRADFDNSGERVHLFNINLSWDLWQRYEQVGILLSDQILNNPFLPCPTVIAGDFGLPFWNCGQVGRSQNLKRAALSVWTANYPSRFPIWGRDRIYLRGPIRAVSGEIVRTSEARTASTHLPLVVELQTKDTRKTIKVGNETRVPGKQPDPVCG